MNNRCPVTYQPVDKSGIYSPGGLTLLSRNLNQLYPLPFTVEEQLFEAARRSGRISIGGVQPKLSALLSPKESSFILVDIAGRYILKPQNPAWPRLPENEDLTMKLAALSGIKTPNHGMVWSKDGSLTYWIARFDRKGKKDKIPVEDFSQLGGYSRKTKYNSSIEKVIQLIEQYTTFPEIEKARFFHRFLFDYITGNNDMHLKNFSVITQKNRIELAPAYDLLNTSLVIKNSEELALPLNGKKNNLTHKDIFTYLAKKRLNLTDAVVRNSIKSFTESIPGWFDLINISFLPEEMKKGYEDIIKERLGKLDLKIV